MMISDPSGDIGFYDQIQIKCDNCGIEYQRKFYYRNKLFKFYQKDFCKKCCPSTDILCSTFLTKSCIYCSKEFKISYSKRKTAKYCSRDCQWKGHPQGIYTKNPSKPLSASLKKHYKCIICDKDFMAYGANRIVCSKKCNYDYASITRVGENNPSSKKHPKTTKKCLYCQKEFSFSRNGMKKGAQKIFCSLNCSKKINVKKLTQNPPSLYPRQWEKEKAKIKERDGYMCCLCGGEREYKEICVHHIDYNKHNLDSSNLISLCQSCHNMTHHGRTFWEILFKCIISNSKIVKKGWGCEVHITNQEKYCLKYLVFFKGKKFSYHYHEKQELWHCVYGKFLCTLGLENGVKETFQFKAGEKIEIPPNVPHQLEALQNSIIVEVSTEDFPADSVRIVKGD